MWRKEGGAEQRLHSFWTARCMWNNAGDIAVLVDPSGAEVGRVHSKAATAAAAAPGAASKRPRGKAKGVKVAILKAALKERGLRVGGKKAELIERLRLAEEAEEAENRGS